MQLTLMSAFAGYMPTQCKVHFYYTKSEVTLFQLDFCKGSNKVCASSNIYILQQWVLPHPDYSSNQWFIYRCQLSCSLSPTIDRNNLCTRVHQHPLPVKCSQHQLKLAYLTALVWCTSPTYMHLRRKSQQGLINNRSSLKHLLILYKQKGHGR